MLALFDDEIYRLGFLEAERYAAAHKVCLLLTRPSEYGRRLVSLTLNHLIKGLSSRQGPRDTYMCTHKFQAAHYGRA